MTASVPTEGSNAFGAALAWIEGTLLGSLGVSVAIIAVAGVGFMLLTGRLDIRRGARVILGSFILFGAATLAEGLLSISRAAGAHAELANRMPEPSYLPAPDQPPPTASATPYDPYAGAAVPTR